MVTNSDEEQEIEYMSGDIVWAKYGRIWYPAKLCCLADLSESLQVRFSKNKDKLIVKWLGENMYFSVASSQIVVFGKIWLMLQELQDQVTFLNSTTSP